MLIALLLAACADPCGDPDARAGCVAPTLSADAYIAQGHAYFDTMDYEPVGTIDPVYGPLVARWEWPPWLKLTGYTRERMIDHDALLALMPSVVRERDCRAFDVNPFTRCKVVFYYDDHDGRPCPIYEEFTFDASGEMTFVEAWSDLDGLRPMPADDPWAEGDDVYRLSAQIPGLGAPDGRHVPLEDPAMRAAAEADPNVADFALHASDWLTYWLADYEAAGDDLWARGCGWN
jgi:hypothetical protein